MSGKYDSLKLKSGQVITEGWFNALGDALNELHAWITDGQHDINTNSASIKTANIELLNAVSASFTNRPTAEGRPVLLDGDPITVADLGDSAKQKITQSIDASITLQSLLTELQPASASGSITATDNTAGFSITLDKGGRPYVNIYYSAGGAATIHLKVSRDGINWRTLKTYSLTVAGEGTDIIQGVAYPYVKLETPTTGIDVVFEVVACF